MTLIFAMAGSCLVAPLHSADLEQVAFFEKRIRPILVEHCSDCHSGEEAESDFRVDSREAILAGGKFGPAVKPGAPKQSLLISAINHDEFLKMPPKEKLSTKEVVDLTRWVRIGAPWTNALPASPQVGVSESEGDVPAFSEDQLQHWAFQTVTRPPLPNVRNRGWLRTPIDHFVLARLEQAGLSPAPPTDRRTFIRRATFDLTGLPPTPAEVTAFVTDPTPTAYETLIDRLLSSPRYGERWGRHWLDVARYADSNGLDENLSYANAFRYRDYVIAAFNQDKAYARFAQEQIAGDLLPELADETAEHERLIATGFLAIGPKMLAEDDPVKMQMDIIDEQLATLGQTFLGLTVGCARCHDHKFDPLPTADYYSLAGIFKSSKTMENHKVVAVWYERQLKTAQRTEEILAWRTKKRQLDLKIVGLEAALHAANLWKQAQLALQGDSESSVSEDTIEKQLKAARAERERLDAAKPSYDVAMGVTEDQPRDLRVHLRGSHIALGAVATRAMPRVLAKFGQPDIPSGHSGRLELAQWLTNPENPLAYRVIVNRLWRWRFGRGIVASVDNFGLLGELPTHPELLDWLALEFLNGGGSIKKLHRLMMLSSTYRMSTAFDSRGYEADPDNRLLWRMRRRRLSGEEVRDAIIHVGGGLDTTMGGSLLKVANRAYVTGSKSNITDEYQNRRRSVYLPVVRSSVYDVLQTLDFPDPAVANGDRATTTVAPQALMMMNGEVVAESTREMAREALTLAEPDRLGFLYQTILGRRPSSREVERSEQFIQRIREMATASSGVDAELQGWQSLARVLLSSNEFFYVE